MTCMRTIWLALIGVLIISTVAALARARSAAPAAAPVPSPFIYVFNVPGILQETGAMDESGSPYWWLNSGGKLIIHGGFGETIQGEDAPGDKWRTLYGQNNPDDTDGGLHPQNLLRLVTRSRWDNVSEQMLFYIAGDNFSPSYNRNTSNGLLLMSRYQDGGQTLYYAGVRVDGTAVIKKKYRGVYYTMAETPVFPGAYRGWQDDTNLLPHGKWLGLRTDTTTNADGSVTLALYLEKPGESSWNKALEATDTGQYGGTPPILGPAFLGIRTDFMDVRFRDFRASTL